MDSVLDDSQIVAEYCQVKNHSLVDFFVQNSNFLLQNIFFSDNKHRINNALKVILHSEKELSISILSDDLLYQIFDQIDCQIDSSVSRMFIDVVRSCSSHFIPSDIRYFQMTLYYFEYIHLEYVLMYINTVFSNLRYYEESQKLLLSFDIVEQLLMSISNMIEDDTKYPVIYSLYSVIISLVHCDVFRNSSFSLDTIKKIIFLSVPDMKIMALKLQIANEIFSYDQRLSEENSPVISHIIELSASYLTNQCIECQIEGIKGLTLWMKDSESYLEDICIDDLLINLMADHPKNVLLLKNIEEFVLKAAKDNLIQSKVASLFVFLSGFVVDKSQFHLHTISCDIFQQIIQNRPNFQFGIPRDDPIWEHLSSLINIVSNEY